MSDRGIWWNLFNKISELSFFISLAFLIIFYYKYIEKISFISNSSLYTISESIDIPEICLPFLGLSSCIKKIMNWIVVKDSPYSWDFRRDTKWISKSYTILFNVYTTIYSCIIIEMISYWFSLLNPLNVRNYVSLDWVFKKS